MTAAQNVLIVDDTPDSLRLLCSTVGSGGYRVRAASNGDMALQMVRAEIPDLILMDIDMPGRSGIEICAVLQADPALRGIPVLFVTAMSAADIKLAAFNGGGRDFVTKPFDVSEMLARVALHLRLRRLELEIIGHNERLTERVAQQVREISESQMATIVALAKLSQSRDDTTGLHVERMGRMAELLCREALVHCPEHSAELERLCPVIRGAAMLHDIGKVAIPDAILLKPGRLTFEEFAIMKTHTTLGAGTLDAVLSSYPSNDFVRVGVEIARSHHERWRGGGYPDGLAGADIPLSARLCAIVDVYDALRSVRPYKVPLPHSGTTAIIAGEFGASFDPGLAQAFARCAPGLEEIWTTMQIAAEAPEPIHDRASQATGRNA